MLRALSIAVVSSLLATMMFVSAASAAPSPIIYRNLPNPVPGNVSSEAFQAQTVSEFGDRIDFEPSTSRDLTQVDVLMSSWGCETGGWSSSDCLTTPSATFSHDITLNVYAVGPSNAVGSLLGTKTQTFAIPYRPSADDTNCTGGDDGKWFNGTTCFNGFATTITFDLTSLALTVPDEVIMSVAYNTTSYGNPPIGAAACGSNCGYDSLNVGLSTAPANVDVGSNPAPNDAYLLAQVGGGTTGYCTNTNLNTFRLDAGCWAGLKAAFTVYGTPDQCTTVCYVDTATGNNSNGGTSLADAKKTIQGGIDAVDVDGTVRVNDGTYNETPVVTKSLTLQSINGRAVTNIQLQSGTTYTSALEIQGDDVTVDGFTIVGFDGDGASILTASNISILAGLDHIVIKNNRLRIGNPNPGLTTGDDGIGVVTYYGSPATESVTVTNNTFEPLGSTASRAFYVNPQVKSFTVNNNTITGNFDRTSVTQANSSLVEDNTVTGTGSGAGLGAAGYDDPYPAGTTKFQGNTISGVLTGIRIDELNNVTVTRNLISSSTVGVRVRDFNDFASFDPSTVHINRNNLAVGSSNTGITTESLTASVDGSCNWWGSYTGPGPIASGTGSKVTSNVEYAPWLQTSNLLGDCDPNGNITIVLDSHPNSPRIFNFTGTNGISPFTLVDNGAPGTNIKTFNKPAGLYVFQVGAVPKWALIKLTCNLHETILKSHRLVQIQLHSDEDVTCTFTESYRVPDASIALASGGPYSGDNIYSGAVLASQKLSQSLAAGQTKSFFVRFQNDGPDSDVFRVASKITGSLKYNVVFMYGNTEITSKVKADTYRFTLAPGATRMIEIRVTAGATVAGDVRNIILTQQSTTAPAARDTVKAFVSFGP